MDATESLAKAIRRLSVAVWCLCLPLIGILGIWLWSLFGLQAMTTRSSTHETFSSAPDRAPGPPDYDEDFGERPLEQKIARASVIVLLQLKEEGGKHKAVVSEILKKAPGTRFYYEVGDEYEMLSHMPRENCGDCEGQGHVVFFVGNPAQMRSAYSYENDRVSGFGDMPIAELRRLAKVAEAGPANQPSEAKP